MTLVELLIVLVIIGILGAVSLRAIDVTRERTNYDKTMKAMQRLANAIAGNPDLVADGRRTDFGFVGDVGRLPTSLDELRRNVSSSPAWNGPYVRIPFTGDSTSFRIDAWGQDFQYLPDRGTILSLANGRFPLTYQVTPDPDFLFKNSVSGTVTDNQGNPPGEQAPTIHVHVWQTNPTTGQPMYYDTVVGRDGSYSFAPPDRGVAVGNHLMTVVRGSESLSKWVAVVPRVGAVVDFRFGYALTGVLRLISGSVAVMPGPTSPVNNVTFEVINTGSTVVKLDTISFCGSDSTAFCETLFFNGGLPKWNWQSPMFRRASNNDPMGFTTEDSVLGMARVRVNLRAFNTEPLNFPGTPKDMHGDSLKMKFSDGSFIGFVIP